LYLATTLLNSLHLLVKEGVSSEEDDELSCMVARRFLSCSAVKVTEPDWDKSNTVACWEEVTSRGRVPMALGDSRCATPAWPDPWAEREPPFLPLLPPDLYTVSESEDSGEEWGAGGTVLTLLPETIPWDRLHTLWALALSLSSSSGERPTTSISDEEGPPWSV
jgi:hypothetical protein